MVFSYFRRHNGHSWIQRYMPWKQRIQHALDIMRPSFRAPSCTKLTAGDATIRWKNMFSLVDAAIDTFSAVTAVCDKLRPASNNAPTKPWDGERRTPLPVSPAYSRPFQPSPAQLSQAKPSQVKPSQAKPSQAKPSQAKPSQAKSSQGKPRQGKPSQTKPSQAKPSPANT